MSSPCDYTWSASILLAHTFLAVLVALTIMLTAPLGNIHACAAVSNGKVFDARSKTWSNTICPAPKGSATATTGSSNQPSSTVKQPGSNGNNTGMGVGGFNSRSSSSIGQVSSIARAPGNGIACSIGKDGGVASGGSTAGGGILHSSSQQRAKTAAQQAELRVRHKPVQESTQLPPQLCSAPSQMMM